MDLLQSPVKSLICSYRPIMDASLRISAYEVVSRRDDDAQALHTDAPSAIISAFLHTGMNDLFSGRPVFVRATPEFLMSELPLLLPEKRIVFQLPAQETLPESYLERISTLARLGYGIALDDFVLEDARKPLLPHVRYVKIDVNSRDLRNVHNMARSRQISGIATHVNTPELLEQARALNFSCYQGCYFAQPKEQAQKTEGSSLDILDLISRLNDDGSDRIIEDFFKSHPALALHLLRLVNYGSSGFMKEIDSIRQVLSLLGRSQLLRWFQLLLYSVDNRYINPNPLLAAAAWRGRFMELVIRHSQHAIGSNLQDQAYMVGMLSMVDALLDRPMAEILPNLHLSSDIRHAVIERTGILGQLLRLAEALQFDELELVEDMARQQNYRIETIMHVQNEAMAWVQQFQRGVSDGATD